MDTVIKRQLALRIVWLALGLLAISLGYACGLAGDFALLRPPAQRPTPESQEPHGVAARHKDTASQAQAPHRQTAQTLVHSAGEQAAGNGIGWVRLCQALGPAAPNPVTGVDCIHNDCIGEAGWDAMGPIPWQAYAQGEYVGPARLEHVPVYRLRVDDILEIIYRLTREETAGPYEFNVGDALRVESFTDEKLNRDLIVPPAVRSPSCGRSWKSATRNTTRCRRSA